MKKIIYNIYIMSYFDYKNKLNFSNYMDQINQLDQTVINEQNKGLELDQLDLQEQTGFLNEAIAQIGSAKSTVDSIKGGAETVIGGLIAQKGMAKLHSLLKKKLGKDDDKEDDADDEDDEGDIADDQVTLGDEDDVADMGDFDDLPPNITQESRFDPGEIDPGQENVTGLETIDEETEDEDPETDEDDDDTFGDDEDDEGDFGDDAATIGDNEDVGNMDDFDDLDGVDNVMDNIGDTANEIVGNIGSKVSDLISEGASRIQNFGQQIMSNFTKSGPQSTTTDVQPDTIELPESEPNLFTGGDGGELPSTWTRAGSGEGDIEMSTLGDNNPTTATGEGAFEGGDTSVQNSANDLSNNLENGIDNEVSNAADDLNDASTAATDAADVGEGATDLADVTTGVTEAGTVAADAGMAAVDAGVATADAVAATTLTIPVVGEVIMGLVALGGAIFSGVEGANEASNEQKEAQDEQEEATDKKQEIANQAAQTQQVFKSSNVIPNLSSTVAQNVTSGAF